MSIHFHLKVIFNEELLFFKAMVKFGSVLVDKHFKASGSLINEFFAFGVENF